MSTLQDNDIFIYQNSDTNTTGTVANSNRSSLDPDKDHFLVQRTDNGTTTTYRVAAGDVGGGSGGDPVISVNVTLTASSEYPNATLTATEPTVINGTKVVDHPAWYKNDVEIPGATGLTYTATESGTYKYEERWVGDNSESVYPSAQVTINKSTVAQPTVIAPANGAGIGEEVTYYPETSEITGSGNVGGWVESTTGYDSYPRGVAYGNGRFIVAGNDYFPWTTDGVNWTEVAAPYNSDWRGIAYGNGVWVAVTDNRTNQRCAYSLDNGNSWQEGTGLDNASSWMDVTYGEPNGQPLFVAVAQAKGGSENHVATSTDGINWTPIQLEAGLRYKFSAITYGNGTYVAVSTGNMPGAFGYVMYSDDGFNWVRSDDTGSGGENRSISYGEPDGVPTFICTCSRSGYEIGISTDNGRTFREEPVETFPTFTPYWSAFGNGVWVALGYRNEAAYSTDGGINWVNQVPLGVGEDSNCGGIVYGTDRFVQAFEDGGAYNTTGTEELKQLTFTNDKAYNEDDGTEVSTIDKAFKAGDKVVGKGDITLFANTACLQLRTLYDGNGISARICIN